MSNPGQAEIALDQPKHRRSSLTRNDTISVKTCCNALTTQGSLVRTQHRPQKTLLRGSASSRSMKSKNRVEQTWSSSRGASPSHYRRSLRRSRAICNRQS
jgi:hypothetical protein